jgi:hypothetical protein
LCAARLQCVASGIRALPNADSVFLAVRPAIAVTRHYYIAAEDVTWDFAPSGHDLLRGSLLPPPWALRTQWAKSRFIEYTDSTFSVRKPQPEWLGILGPIIRAEVGDQVEVEFLNRSKTMHSIHPHGLRYDKDNEGAFYLPYGDGSRVGHVPASPITGLPTKAVALARANSAPSCGGTTRILTNPRRPTLGYSALSSLRLEAKLDPTVLPKASIENSLPPS